MAFLVDHRRIAAGGCAARPSYGRTGRATHPVRKPGRATHPVVGGAGRLAVQPRWACRWHGLSRGSPPDRGWRLCRPPLLRRNGPCQRSGTATRPCHPPSCRRGGTACRPAARGLSVVWPFSWITAGSRLAALPPAPPTEERAVPPIRYENRAV